MKQNQNSSEQPSLQSAKKTSEALQKINLKKQRRLEKLEADRKLYERINPHKINLLNIWQKYPKKVLWMFVSALLYNLAITVFLKKAATIASGTSSLAQIITFTVPSTENFYGLFYVLINMPLMFIF